MSKFYAEVSNNRSTITKCGHSDGLDAHIRGWHAGVRVSVGCRGEKGDEEYYSVYLTSGSSGGRANRLLFAGTKKDVQDYLDGKTSAPLMSHI